MNKLTLNAFIITFGIVFCKLIGFLFIIPFTFLISDSGLSLYSYAYIPYSLFIDISTLGIPVGLAKVISIYEGDDIVISYILSLCLRIVLFISFFSIILINIFANSYANLLTTSNSYNSITDVVIVIRIISISLLFVGISGVYRGYYQGIERFFKVSVSQILEQLVRVAYILLVSFIIVKIYYLSDKIAVKFSLLGPFLGGFTSFIYLKFNCKEKQNKPIDDKSKKESRKLLLKYSLVNILYGISFSIILLSDQVLIQSIYIKQGIDNYQSIYGIYSFKVQKIIFLFFSISIGFGFTLLPNVSKLYKDNDIENINNKVNFVILILNLLLIPIFLLLFFNSKFIYSIIFSRSDIGIEILKYYSVLIIPYSMYTITTSILQSINQSSSVVINISLGLILKVIFGYIFISRFLINGAILSTLFSLLFIVIINFVVIVKKIHTNLTKSLVISLIYFIISMVGVYEISILNISIIYTFVCSSLYLALVFVVFYYFVTFKQSKNIL